jgi:hypothetical protein
MGTAPGTSQLRGVQPACRVEAVYSTELVRFCKFMLPRNNNKETVLRIGVYIFQIISSKIYVPH